MKFAICNEIFWTEDKSKWTLRRQFEAARSMGFSGIEISPFTLNFDARQITDEQKREIVDCAGEFGVAVAGIHWLLSHTEGYHVTSPDPEVRERTALYMEDLVRLGIEIGGSMMVVGSPLQRAVKDGVSYAQAWEWFRDCMKRCGEVALDADFKVCIEPLAVATQNNFIYKADEARKMAREINLPTVGVILDTYSGSQEEADLPQEIRNTADLLYHYHCNDLNKRAPGWGDTDFVPIMKALLDIDYQRYCSIEVFDFSLDAYEHCEKGLRTLERALEQAKAEA
ncbi:MAG: sugar phosphate isomerase/epimerase [Armatimonadetes bacterium]|nr:sugar phosphate isomerase/epimerase [Armatimonadota bacterium]